MRGWLLYSNLHIVPVAAGFVLGTYALSGVSADLSYVVLATCGAFLIYQWDRASGLSPEDEINVPGRRRWLLDRPFYLIGSSALALTGVAWSMWVSSGLVRGAAILLGVLGISYAVPLVFGRRPKEVSGVKNFLVAGCWVGGGVVLPLVDASAGSTVILWLSIHRICYVLPNLVVAEKADRPGDEAAGLHRGCSPFTWSPYRISILSLIVAGGLAIAVLNTAWISGSAIADQLPILLAVDLVGLLGATWTVRRPDAFNYRHVVLLDAWVAFPLVTWMVSMGST